MMSTATKVQLKWVLGAFVAVLVIDQVTKAIIIHTLEPFTPYRPDTFFYFVHQRNEGLIGGAFSGFRIVTYAAPLLATGVLLYLFRHINTGSRIQATAYGMVLGGAIGNLTDRVIHQSVTDFLQFHFYFIPFDFPWKHYPAFNVADSGIFVGVAILVLTWNITEESDAPDPV